MSCLGALAAARAGLHARRAALAAASVAVRGGCARLHVRRAVRAAGSYPPLLFSRSTLPFIDKKKFLVPMDLTIGQFIYVIRKVPGKAACAALRASRLRRNGARPYAPPSTPRRAPRALLQRIALRPEQAIFLFVSRGTLPPTVSSLQAVYEAHKDPDGFLYMTYSGETTFGVDHDATEPGTPVGGPLVQ